MSEPFVMYVHTYKDSLVEVFNELQDGTYTPDTYNAAVGCGRYLNDERFLFWLNLFNQIMCHVEILYKQLQSTQVTVEAVKRYTLSFSSHIKYIRNSHYTEHSALSAAAKEVM